MRPRALSPDAAGRPARNIPGVQRVLAIGIAIVVAAAAAWLLVRRGETPAEASAPIERLLAAGRPADARKELDAARPHLDRATRDYLDGIIFLAEAKDADAAAALSRAQSVRPEDWRIVGALAAALANAGRFPEAVTRLEAYAAAVPEDERGLVTLAQYLLDAKRGRPDPARALALLDRADALPRRAAPAGDPTAVPADRSRYLRTEALIRLDRGMDALISARAGTRDFPQGAEAWFLLGEAARRMAKASESVDAYRRAAQLAPGSRRYLEQFALALIEFGGEGREILAVADALLARSPGDPALLLLRARALVRTADPRIDADAKLMEEAASIYRDLLKREDVPPGVKQDARRNLGVLLYDWKVGGRPGEYLDEAYGHLKEWVRLGGVVDDSLRPAWEELEERDRKTKEKR